MGGTTRGAQAEGRVGKRRGVALERLTLASVTSAVPPTCRPSPILAPLPPLPQQQGIGLCNMEGEGHEESSELGVEAKKPCLPELSTSASSYISYVT